MSKKERVPQDARHKPPRSEADPRSVLRIRLLLLGLLFGAIPLTYLVGDTLYNQLIRDDEGAVDLSPPGSELTGGDIIDERSLVGRLVEVINQKRPVEPDPTIVKSLLYHASKFYGMTDEAKIRRRINNVFRTNSDTSSCLGDACVYNTRRGLTAELTNNLFSPDKNQAGQWISFVAIVAHEAYHLNVDRVLNIGGIEDYGFAGKYNISSEKRGFHRAERYDGQTNLIHRVFQDPKTKQLWPIVIPEEFFAEVGQRRYLKHLLNLGLNQVAFPENFPLENLIAFPSMAQGVVNALDDKGVAGKPSWQAFWQGRMNSTRVDKFHYQSDRFGFFQDIANAIIAKNKNKTPELSAEDEAGLGALALADFAHHGISGYQILASLIKEPLTSSFLQDQATQLSTKLNQLLTLDFEYNFPNIAQMAPLPTIA